MPEEKQRKSMRTSEFDKMINKLQSLEIISMDIHLDPHRQEMDL